MLQSTTGNGTSRQNARMVAADARIMGTVIIAGRGAGKTTLESMLAFDSFLKGHPGVVLDPLGTLTDALLFRITTFLQHVPPALHSSFWDRLVYADMAGTTGFVCPFPIYHTGEGRSLWETSERFMHVLSLTNPTLQTTAPISWPEMHRIGVFTGMICAALGMELTEAASLLTQTTDWLPRMLVAAETQEELAPALSFFQDEYLLLSRTERNRRSSTFLDHVFPLATDPQLRVVFGAKRPGITWQEVEQKGLTVILDFRNITSAASKRFALLWVFVTVYEYLKTRGRQETPFVLTIDEFAALTQKVSDTTNPLASLLDEFIQQYLRNSSIWFTCAFQSINQLDEQLRNTILSLCTYVFGRAGGTMREARELSDALYLTDPFRLKHWRRVWARDDPVSYLLPSHRADKLPFFVLDLEPQFMELQEQQELFAQTLHNLNLWEFLLRPAVGEGEVSREVFPISIASAVIDPATGMPQFPDPVLISTLRSGLAAKTGIPAAVIRKEQQERLSALSPALQSHEIPAAPDRVQEGAPPDTPTTRPTLTPQQQAFLQFLCAHPDAPITQISKGLGVRTQQAAHIRERLKEAGFLVEVEIRSGTPRGRPAKYLIPTTAAWEELGREPPAGRGGVLHRHIQQLVATGAAAKGYTVHLEQPLASGAIVDVHVEKDKGERLAIEIASATRVSREVAHIRHCLAAGYTAVYVIFVDESLRQQTAAALKQAFTPTEQAKVVLLPFSRLSQIGAE